MGENKNKRIKQCVDKIEKSPCEHYIWRKLFYFWNKFLYFQSCKRKFTMFQKSFYMFKTFKKNMWTSGFFLYQKFLSLIKCSPNHFNFFVNLDIFHKKGSMCSKHSKNKNTYIILHFNTWMSFYIIIVLNL